MTTTDIDEITTNLIHTLMHSDAYRHYTGLMQANILDLKITMAKIRSLQLRAESQ